MAAACVGLFFHLDFAARWEIETIRQPRPMKAPNHSEQAKASRIEARPQPGSHAYQLACRLSAFEAGSKTAIDSRLKQSVMFWQGCTNRIITPFTGHINGEFAN